MTYELSLGLWILAIFMAPAAAWAWWAIRGDQLCTFCGVRRRYHQRRNFYSHPFEREDR